jgi:hydroxyacylglutathione hydrolase
MNLIALPAFTDNYIWMLHNSRSAIVVDPGDANVVLDALARLNVQLETILVTHHHNDHTGGVAALREATDAAVYGPAREAMPEPIRRLDDGDQVQALGLTFSVMNVPGHTAGHIAYFCAANSTEVDGKPLLFCGDTLFSGGCGRLFEGTPAQMLASLGKLAALPANTRVCCTHEYTLSNLRFARAVEPNNAALAQYQLDCLALRARGDITLPSSIALELQINPFLRSDEPEVIRSAQQFDPTAQGTLGVFTAIRQWKNQFQ